MPSVTSAFCWSLCIAAASHAAELNPSYVVFSLTLCREPPAGINVEEGKHYNPYFPGGVIGMKQVGTLV